MFKTLFGKETTKANVVFAIAGAIAASFKAYDTYLNYKAEQENKENQK